MMNLECPQVVPPVNSKNCPTSTGLGHQHAFILAAVRRCPTDRSGLRQIGEGAFRNSSGRIFLKICARVVVYPHRQKELVKRFGTVTVSRHDLQCVRKLIGVDENPMFRT
jgi:hypothetical protein